MHLFLLKIIFLVHPCESQSQLINPLYKVLLAVTLGLSALATLIEACGDATSMTACELLVEIANGKRGDICVMSALEPKSTQKY